VIALNEMHLRRILISYFRYCHAVRTRLGLGKACPVPRHIEPPHLGSVSEQPTVGGLHHRYFRKVA
jgi:hypothetical protein